jgi:hypothetical protein
VGVALDQPDLVDVREREVGGGGQHLDGAGGDAAVTGVDVTEGDRYPGPGRALSAAKSLGWFSLTVNTNPAPRSCRYWAWAR